MFKQRKTVAGILAGFQKTVDQLEALVVANSRRMEENENTVERINAEQAALHGENANAQAAAAKLRELISA